MAFDVTNSSVRHEKHFPNTNKRVEFSSTKAINADPGGCVV
jgi:hypothetical protein